LRRAEEKGQDAKKCYILKEKLRICVGIDGKTTIKKRRNKVLGSDLGSRGRLDRFDGGSEIPSVELSREKRTLKGTKPDARQVYHGKKEGESEKKGGEKIDSTTLQKKQGKQ